MTQPTTIGNVPGKGRIQYTLDPGSPNPKIIQTADVVYTFSSVPAGDHIIRADLVNNNYQTLSPAVFAQVEITVPAVR